MTIQVEILNKAVGLCTLYPEYFSFVPVNSEIPRVSTHLGSDFKLTIELVPPPNPSSIIVGYNKDHIPSPYYRLDLIPTSQEKYNDILNILNGLEANFPSAAKNWQEQHINFSVLGFIRLEDNFEVVEGRIEATQALGILNSGQPSKPQDGFISWRDARVNFPKLNS